MAGFQCRLASLHIANFRIRSAVRAKSPNIGCALILRWPRTRISQPPRFILEPGMHALNGRPFFESILYGLRQRRSLLATALEKNPFVQTFRWLNDRYVTARRLP